jgi:hypothetical protein
MARPGRYYPPDQPLHVIQRGNNRQPIFFAQGDHARYREWLAAARREAYRALFADAPDPDFVDDLRKATNGGWALGDAAFKRRIAEALGRRVDKLTKGRPPKVKAPSATGREHMSTLTPLNSQ